MSSSAKYSDTTFLDRDASVPAMRPIGSMRMDVAFSYLVLVTMVLSTAVPVVRWVNYALPLIALLLIIGNKKVHTGDLSKPYLLLVLFGVLSAPLAARDGFQDIYLILTGCAGALVGFRRFWSWRTLFWICMGGQVLFLVSSATGGGQKAFSFTNIEFDPANSASSFESNLSFVFSMLAVWAIYLKRWKEFVIASVMAFLTLKRIALLGVLVCLMVTLLPGLWRQQLLRPIPMLILNGLFLSGILLFGSGFFDEFIVRWTSMSPNELGMGRQVLHQNIVREILAEPWSFTLFGSGAGDAYAALRRSMLSTAKENLHADTLKILYEYGAIILCAFIVLLYRTRHQGVALLALYMNIVLLTDNTLIYPFFIYFATLIAATMIKDDEESRPAKSDAADVDDAEFVHAR